MWWSPVPLFHDCRRTDECEVEPLYGDARSVLVCVACREHGSGQNTLGVASVVACRIQRGLFPAVLRCSAARTQGCVLCARESYSYVQSKDLGPGTIFRQLVCGRTRLIMPLCNLGYLHTSLSSGNKLGLCPSCFTDVSRA